MDRYVCIHGHFYQPPRENPWLEAIEEQESAYPYHDWNERITEECYLPNARSQILDDEAWVEKISNNYSRMSFNFGPTLLSWLEAHAPETYVAIIDADRASAEAFGRGSAMAQVYNHMIMPLANDRDKRTQVIWGVRDFEHRYGRRPEGMWLAETAVDVPTLECLAEQGIAFTVLAPHQASRYKGKGGDHWIDVDGIDPSRAYEQTLASGRTISLLFYDGPVSQAVAFERLLHSGLSLSDRIAGAFVDEREGAQLAHIATDGETYGHHHRHGDMALAYALERFERDGLGTVTNYASFLQAHPPALDVQIVENSSWSCCHGVERWKADCGCHSGMHGDWNQGWRAPLRAALDWLRDELAPVFERLGGAVLRDPWAARDAYIDVILDRSDASLDRFFDAHAKETLDEQGRTRVLKLLEMQRHAMLMYTSCGWFFDDLAGIETVQVILYAARAIQITRDSFEIDLEEGFLERLAFAHSNLAHMGNGRDIYEHVARPAMVDLREVAAHAAISSLFDPPDEGVQQIYCYSVDLSTAMDLVAGHAHLRVGRVDVQSRITRASGSFEFAMAHLGDHVVNGGVRPAGEGTAAFEAAAQGAFEQGDFVELLKLVESHFGGASYSLKSLFRDQQRAIVHRVMEGTLENVRSVYRDVHQRHAPLLRYHSGLAMDAPRELMVAAELVLNDQIRRALEGAPETLARVDELLETARADRVRLDVPTLAFAAATCVERAARAWEEDPANVDRLTELMTAVDVIDRLPFDVDHEGVQHAFYTVMCRVRGRMAARAGRSTTARRWVEAFDDLGARLRVRIAG